MEIITASLKSYLNPIYVYFKLEFINENKINKANAFLKTMSLEQKKDSNLISLLLQSQYNKKKLLLFNRRLIQRRFQTIDLSTKFEIKSGHSDDNSNSQAYCLSLDNQDCRYLLSGGSDGLVVLYDLETFNNNNNNNNNNTSGSSNNYNNYNNNELINTNELNDISKYKTNIILPLDKSRRHDHHLSSIQWHPSDTGAFLTSGFDGNLFIWDTNSFEVAGSFKLATSLSEICKIFHARMSNDHGGLIACALSDSTIRLCDPRTGDCSHLLIGHKMSVTKVDWSPIDPYTIASSSLDGRVKLWDIRRAGSTAAIKSFDWQQDHTASTRLVTDISGRRNSNERNNNFADKMTIRRLDNDKDQVAKAHDSAVMSMKYSPCGHYIISSGNDNRIRLWDSKNGKLNTIRYSSGCISQLPYDLEIANFSSTLEDVLISPNGRNGDICLTQLHSSSGESFRILKGHLNMVYGLVYRPNMQQIISCAKDGMIYIWNASSNKSRIESNDSYNNLEINNYDNNDEKDEDSWSDLDENEFIDGKDSSDVNNNVNRCFVPPIIQRYLDDVKSIQSNHHLSSSSSSSSLYSFALEKQQQQQTYETVSSSTLSFWIQENHRDNNNRMKENINNMPITNMPDIKPKEMKRTNLRIQYIKEINNQKRRK